MNHPTMTNNYRKCGTDGVRGAFNQEPLTKDTLMHLAHALGCWMQQRHLARLCMARDTRHSGIIIAEYFSSILPQYGIDVIDYNILPTPVLAWLTVHTPCHIGIMITASHNPATDNGIKFISATGGKWSAEDEASLCALWSTPLPQPSCEYPGVYTHITYGWLAYHTMLSKRIPCTLSGMRIILDLAHGAGTPCIPDYLKSLGADLITLNNSPDGNNINVSAACLEPSLLIPHVIAHQAVLGCAVDGDSDRIIIIDDKGRIWDGDDLLYLLVCADRHNGIQHSGVVLTHMNNGGLALSLEQLKIPTLRTDVGDKHIARALSEHHWSLGGESCGHIIDYNYGISSDPLIIIMRILHYLQSIATPLSALPQPQHIPQLHTSLRKEECIPIDALISFLHSTYPHIRWVARASGTEPIVRIMGEYADQSILTAAMADVVHYTQKSGIEYSTDDKLL